MTSSTKTLLSQLVIDVANAVAGSQNELDRLANQSSGELPLAPLAFMVKQTQVTLFGNLSMRPGETLNFSTVARVQAGLTGNATSALCSRISILIEAVEPSYGH